MNQSDEKGKTAVDELFEEDSPEGYYETISKFYEAYVSSPQNDGASADQRTQVLMHFKSIRRFLYRSKQERKKVKKKESVWIS